MSTDELLHDPDMDRALRDLLPAFPRFTTATARQRDDLLAFIETGVVTQRAEHAAPHDPGRMLELVAERPKRQRRARVLGGVAAGVALLAGLLVAPRWQGAERPLGTVPSPTAAPTTSPTTDPAPTDQLLLPDRFPIIPPSHPLAGEATAMYGGMSFGDLSMAQALVAVDDGTTLADAVVLMAYAQISDEMFPGDAEPVTVAGIAGTIYTEHGTPEISTLVVPGPVPVAIQALDPIAFVEAAGGVPIVDARVGADGGVTFEVGALPADYQVMVERQQPVSESVSAMTRVPDGENSDGNSVIVQRWNPMIGWAIVGDLERIDVNGITGWKQDRGPGSTVIWQVSDLTWAMIGGAMDVDAAVDLARAVEFTDRATWEARYDVELGTYPTREDLELGAAATTAPPTTAPDVLDTPTFADIDRRACPVIGTSPSNFDRRIEIDCGSDDGLRVGMPVVNAAGLVGKITTVALDTAVVMLVADPQYSVMVSIAGGDGPVTGVLRGMGSDRLPQASLTESDGATGSPTVGDAVTTAGGTDSQAPPGLPVGQVAAVDVSSGEPVYDVQSLTDVDPNEPLVVLLYVPPREAAGAETG